jgi:hypothetical protein
MLKLKAGQSLDPANGTQVDFNISLTDAGGNVITRPFSLDVTGKLT